MRFYLANGQFVVPENEQETAFLLERFGLAGANGVTVAATPQTSPAAPAAPAAPAVQATWTTDRANHFMAALGESSRKLVLTLMRMRAPMTTADAARAMSLKDAKGLGSMMATIRRVADDNLVQPPVSSEITGGGARVLRLDPEFRLALEARNAG